MIDCSNFLDFDKLLIQEYGASRRNRSYLFTVPRIKLFHDGEHQMRAIPDDRSSVAQDRQGVIYVVNFFSMLVQIISIDQRVSARLEIPVCLPPSRIAPRNPLTNGNVVSGAERCGTCRICHFGVPDSRSQYFRRFILSRDCIIASQLYSRFSRFGEGIEKARFTAGCSQRAKNNKFCTGVSLTENSR